MSGRGIKGRSLLMNIVISRGVAESLATFIKINFHRDELDIARMGTSSEVSICTCTILYNYVNLLY